MLRYRTIIADPPWPFQWSGGKGGRRRRETEIGYDTMTVAEIAGLEEPHLFADPSGCNLFMWATDEMYREGYAVRVVRAWGFEPCGPPIIWAKDNFGVGVFPRAGHEPLMICRTRGVKAFWNPVPQSNSTHSVQHWSQPRLGKNGGKQHSGQRTGTTGAGLLLSMIRSGEHELEPDLTAERPTGWRWVRGDGGAAGTYVEDPEGVDRLPAGYDFTPAPTRKPEDAADLAEVVSPGPYLEMFARRTRFGWDTWGDEALNTAEMVS